MYRHPFYNIADFKNNLIETVEKINYKKVIFHVSGDFNTDYLKYNTCSRVSSYGCKLLIDKPTRITRSTAICIDHFYTNDQVNKIKIGILINNITDHLPLLINIRTYTHKIQPEKYKYSCFKNFDLNYLFLEDVSKSMAFSEQTFKAIYPTKDDFTSKNVFTDIINMHAPMREATKKQRNLLKKPWMTKTLFKSINT